MALDGRASQRLRCTRSPCTDGKTPQIESRHLRFRHPEIPDARNSTQPQADTDLDGAWEVLFEKSGQNAAQRRKGGVVLEPHKNSFSKNSLVFVLPVSFAVLPAACGYESGGSPDAPAAA